MSKEAFPYTPEADRAYSENLARHFGELAVEMFALGPRKELQEMFHPIKAIKSWRQS